MSPEEFWHGHPKLAEAYREAELARRDNRFYSEWRQGLYVLQALLSAAPAYREWTKGAEHEYPKEPLFSTRPAKAETEEDRERALMEQNKARFIAMAEKLNAELAERRAAGRQGEE